MSTPVEARVVIVGAGLGALRTAELLREGGHTGKIILIGDEVHPPYDRPPLSKAFLREDPATAPWLREDAELLALGVELRLSRRATGLDTTGREVTLDDGTVEPYDVLVIATGAVPKTLPGTTPMPGLHVLRTLDDARELASGIRETGEVVIVGAGFIGCEVAATAIGLDIDVTLVEALPAPLLRVAGREIAAEMTALHLRHDVDLRCDSLVSEVLGKDRVEGVVLSNGDRIASRHVLVALGVTPATSWLSGSGVKVSDGVRCDDGGRTSAPGVYAVGDVAHWAPPREGLLGRHEHWTSAGDQAAVVAANILGRPGDEPARLREVPYFWSDLFGLKLQALGWPSGERETVAFRAGRDGDRLVVLYGSSGTLVGIAGFGVPRVVMSARRMLDGRWSVDEALDELVPSPAIPSAPA